MMLSTAILAARTAGDRLKEIFGEPVKVNESTAHDIKIQADIDSQELIYSIILKDFPDHKLIGEEGDAGNPASTMEWIVDPIDGTLNFATGLPHFCVSIAARQNGQTLLGVVYDPIRDELFTTQQGKPSLLNGRPIKVSPRNRVSEAVLAVGFSKTADSVDHCLKLYTHYGHAAKKLRALGSAALDLAYVASGRLDAYIEQGISLWDIAAGVLLVENAGGKVELTPKSNGKFKVVARSGNIEFPVT